MNDRPLFPPKRGLTKEERRKVEAFIRAGKMTVCEAVGSAGLAERGAEETRKWLEGLSRSWKAKAGFNPVRPERTEKERRGRKREKEREWRRRKQEENGKADA